MRRPPTPARRPAGGRTCCGSVWSARTRFDAPAACRTTSSGSRRYLRARGHQPHILAPGELGSRPPELGGRRRVHLRRQRRLGAVQRLDRPGELRPAECGPGPPLAAAGTSSTWCTSTSRSPPASRCWPCGRPTCRWSRPSTPPPRGPARCSWPAACCAAPIEKIDAGIAVSESARRRGRPAPRSGRRGRSRTASASPTSPPPVGRRDRVEGHGEAATGHG